MKFLIFKHFCRCNAVLSAFRRKFSIERTRKSMFRWNKQFDEAVCMCKCKRNKRTAKAGIKDVAYFLAPRLSA